MYFSVQLQDPKDSRLFQFLYKDPTKDLAEMEVFSFRYICMGSRDAAFQTSSCIRKIADLVRDTKPEVAQTLMDMYVDDGNAYGNSAESCNEILKESIKTLEMYNFRTHKIISDNAEVLKGIPKEKLSATKDIIKHGKEFTTTHKKDEAAIQSSKCLGVHFKIDPDSKTSVITYDHWPKLASTDLVTKREVSRLTSSLWDPIGLYSPATLRGKLCLSEAYKLAKELKMFYKDSKKFGNKEKPTNITWDTDLRKLKMPSKALQSRLEAFNV